MRAIIGYNLAALTLILNVFVTGDAVAQAVQHGDKYYEEPVQKYGDPVQKNDRSVTTPRSGPGEDEQAGVGVQMQETGFYQAGPRDGAYHGARRSLGIGGGGITLPAIKLSLPSIELPHLFKTHHSARMLYEGGVAPWVSTGYRAVAQKATGTRAVSDSGASRGVQGDEEDSKSRGTDGCEDLRQEYERKISELQRKLDECEQLKRCIEDWQKNQSQAYMQGVPNESPQHSPTLLHPAPQMRLDNTEAPQRLPVQPASHLQPVGFFQPIVQREAAPISRQYFKRLPAIDH